MKIRKLSFRLNLYSIFIISVLIPFFMASLIFTIYYNYIIKKQDTQNISNIMTSISQNIHTQIVELGTMSTTCYMHSNILESMKSFNNPQLYSYYDSLELNRLENDYTMAMTKLLYTSQQAIYNISFFPIADNWEVFYSLSKSSAGMKMIQFKNYQQQDWFRQAVESDGSLLFYPAHVPYYLGEDRPPAVFSAVKLIVDMDSKKHIGVLKIDSRLSNLEQLLQNLDIGQGNHLVIMDTFSQVIVGDEKLPSVLPAASGRDVMSIEGTDYHMTALSLDKTDWKLLYLSDNGSAAARIFLSVLLSLGGMGIGVILAFFIYRFRSHTLVYSVANITDTIHQFECGNLQARSVVDADHELKIISDELNTMADKLEHYIQKEFITVINQQKAEYKALQSQINPHFLYNTLNGFIALNRMGEKKKLEESILHLTHLFRYTCTTRDTTLLVEEVGFLKEYLDLQKLKYDDRLEFSIFLAPECHDFAIPKLLLQPIVENSILHGLEPTDHTIQIWIVCQLIWIKGIGERMLILISDDGVGFHPIAERGGDESVGLSNVEARAALFLPGSICHTISAPGRGTKTVFIFPVNTEEGGGEPI